MIHGVASRLASLPPEKPFLGDKPRHLPHPGLLVAVLLLQRDGVGDILADLKHRVPFHCYFALLFFRGANTFSNRELRRDYPLLHRESNRDLVACLNSSHRDVTARMIG